MREGWQAVARRAVEGLGVRPGELILVRDYGGRGDILTEMMLAIEQAGATPLPKIQPESYVQRLLATMEPALLIERDRHWLNLIGQVDRILVLATGRAPRAGQYPAAFAAWSTAHARTQELADARRLPNIGLAALTQPVASRLETDLVTLEDKVLPALAAPAALLQGELERALRAVGNAKTLTLRTGEGCELHLALGDRHWHSDDGVIDEADRAAGSIISNLPAGSIYSTVLESETRGRVWLQKAGPASDVTLVFHGGRVTAIEATSGGAELAALLDQHSGEPRRVSHLGIGLNPLLTGPVNWVLIDEHVHGAIFLALGENRYMGGRNASALNVDFVIGSGTLLADDREIVALGSLLF